MGIHFCSFYFKSYGHNQGGVLLNGHVLSSPGGSGTGEGRDLREDDHEHQPRDKPSLSPELQTAGAEPGGAPTHKSTRNACSHTNNSGTSNPGGVRLYIFTRVYSSVLEHQTTPSGLHHRNQVAQTPPGMSWPLTDKRSLGFSPKQPVLSAVVFILVLLRNDWHASRYRLRHIALWLIYKCCGMIPTKGSANIHLLIKIQ